MILEHARILKHECEDERLYRSFWALMESSARLRINDMGGYIHITAFRLHAFSSVARSRSSSDAALLRNPNSSVLALAIGCRECWIQLRCRHAADELLYVFRQMHIVVAVSRAPAARYVSDIGSFARTCCRGLAQDVADCAALYNIVWIVKHKLLQCHCTLWKRSGG